MLRDWYGTILAGSTKPLTGAQDETHMILVKGKSKGRGMSGLYVGAANVRRHSPGTSTPLSYGWITFASGVDSRRVFGTARRRFTNRASVPGSKPSTCNAPVI